MAAGGTESSSARTAAAKKLFLGGAKYSWVAMLALWLVFAMNANMRNFFFVVEPSIVNEFSVSPQRIGAFAAFVTLAQAILVIPAAAWSDKGGHGWARKFREVPVALGYMIFSLLTGVALFTQTLFNVFILQAIKNMFGGAGESIEVTAVAEWWPFERRGFAQGLHHTAYPWGTLLGGFGVSVILGVFGPENWRYVFLILPWLMIPVLAFYWIVSNPRAYRDAMEDIEESELTAPEIGDDTAGAPPGALGRTLKNPNVIVTAICSGLGLSIYTGITFWLPLYLAFVAKYSLAAVAAYSVLFTITGGVGQIFWGSVSDRLGRKYTLIICFLWLALGVFLLQYTNLSLALLIGVQLFAGLATNGIYPVLYAFSSDSSEPSARAIGNGLQMVGQGIGGMSPLVLGALIALGGGFNSATGFLYGLYFMVALMIIAAILVLLFTRETIGAFKDRDWALVSRRATEVDW